MKRDIITVRCGAFLGLVLLLCAASASAQMYKWTDANGKTHFTDTPPPATAKAAPLKGTTSVGGGASSDMPYALANAVRNFPVTLYTTQPCGGCDSGRSYLKSRGIPFAEKTVTTAAEADRIRSLGGTGNLPFFVVGSSKATGFQQDNWESMLNVAQYPAKKMLPSTYQYPAAVATVPAEAKSPDAEREAARQSAAAEEEQQARKKALAPQTAPPGFRF
jgi:glutaredoxin